MASSPGIADSPSGLAEEARVGIDVPASDSDAVSSAAQLPTSTSSEAPTTPEPRLVQKSEVDVDAKPVEPDSAVHAKSNGSNVLPSTADDVVRDSVLSESSTIAGVYEVPKNAIADDKHQSMLYKPESTTATLADVTVEPTLPELDGEVVGGARKGFAFWMCMVAVFVSSFLSGLDLSAVGTALPTITKSLNGGDNFSWVGSAYALASTASMPLSAVLADAFGRKGVMLGSVVLFAIGSALAGAAQNMNMIIAARTVQGLGGGAIMAMTDIIISDLVPLAERGIFQGLLGLVWAIAAGIGPPIGGAFAGTASWRWLFYLNLPLTGIAFTVVLFFLRVRSPAGSAKEKLLRVDWLGNLIIITGTTLAIIGLTWAGIRYSWASAQVLVPLILGLAILCVALLYEWNVPKQPTIPLDIVSNRTSLSAYLSTAVHGVVSISIIYYIPVYFQGSLMDSPLRSGVSALPLSLVMAPAGALPGIIIQLMGKYRLSNWFGWIVLTVGCGILSLLRADDPVGKWVGYQIIAAFGGGFLFSATLFPILAPLPVSRNAAALGFFSFVRSFAQTWGIAISGTILQNQLKKKLPAAFISRFPEGTEIAYAAIPEIRSLPEPLRTEVRVAFASSMTVIWQTMTGICGLGLLTLFFLREIPMGQVTDEKYGFEHDAEEKKKTGSIEKA